MIEKKKHPRALQIAVLMVVALIGLLGCEIFDRGTYLVVSIDGRAGAQLISTSEFQVTELKVEVLDSEGMSVDVIKWYPEHGRVRVPVAVERLGEYSLEVTHYGVKDEETIEVTETVVVGIVSMKITVIDIVPGAVEVVTIDPGSEGPTYAEVQELMQLVFYAQLELAPTLTSQVLEDGTEVFADPALTWILYPDQTVVFTECSVSGSEITFTGSTAMISQTGTETGFEALSAGTITYVGSNIETVEVETTLAVTQDFVTGEFTGAVITGTAIADGVEFDVSEMELGPIWLDGFLILMEVIS